jgi:hypothetical protein
MFGKIGFHISASAIIKRIFPANVVLHYLAPGAFPFSGVSITRRFHTFPHSSKGCIYDLK